MRTPVGAHHIIILIIRRRIRIKNKIEKIIKNNNNSFEKRAINLNEGRAGCGRCSLNPFEPKGLNPKPET